MTVGSRLIEEAIKLFEKKGWPLSVIREMDEGKSLRVAILNYVSR